MKILLTTIVFISLNSGVNAAVTSIGSFTNNIDGSYTISTGRGAVTDTGVEHFLDLSSGAIDSVSTTRYGTMGNATEGSAFREDISVVTGEVFSFDWLWLTQEAPDVWNNGWNDFAFVSLSLDGISVFANTFTPTHTSDTFSWIANSTGILTFGVGVMDERDIIVDSKVTVSNIRVKSVPEASSLLLIGLGLLGLFGVLKRKV